MQAKDAMLASVIVRLAAAPPRLLAGAVESPGAQRARFLLAGARCGNNVMDGWPMDWLLIQLDDSLRPENLNPAYPGITRWVCECGYRYVITDCGNTNASAPCLGEGCGLRLGNALNARGHVAAPGQRKVNVALENTNSPEFQNRGRARPVRPPSSHGVPAARSAVVARRRWPHQPCAQPHEPPSI